LLPTIQFALQQAYQQLSSSTPRLDAEILLSYVLKKNRSYLTAWNDKLLTFEQDADFKQLLNQRIAGEPIAYLIGEKEFWSLSLQVNKFTLIPRPETEILVEQALLRLTGNRQVIDLGTGCGTIALALAYQLPTLSIIASDCDPNTLAMAQHNAQRLQLHQIKFRLSHWFDNLTDLKANMIVSNPPYIAEFDPHLSQGDLRYEPRHALVSGNDGLTAIRHIIQQAPHYLLENGWLLLEHGYDQGQSVRKLLQQNYQLIETIRDLSGLERITLGLIKKSFS